MPYTFQLFIGVFSPSLTLRLFGEVVLPGGGDLYEVSQENGAYVLRSRYIMEWENERILKHTGMKLRTCVSCSILKPDEVDVDSMIERLIYRIGYEVSHDFILLENVEDVILMRKNLEAVLNDSAENRFEIDDYVVPHKSQHLPKLNLKEENENGNDMDNRN